MYGNDCYDLQIDILTNNISVIQDMCASLEEENKIIESALAKIQEDSSDIILFLNASNYRLTNIYNLQLEKYDRFLIEHQNICASYSFETEKLCNELQDITFILQSEQNGLRNKLDELCDVKSEKKNFEKSFLETKYLINHTKKQHLEKIKKIEGNLFSEKILLVAEAKKRLDLLAGIIKEDFNKMLKDSSCQALANFIRLNQQCLTLGKQVGKKFILENILTQKYHQTINELKIINKVNIYYQNISRQEIKVLNSQTVKYLKLQKLLEDMLLPIYQNRDAKINEKLYKIEKKINKRRNKFELIKREIKINEYETSVNTNCEMTERVCLINIKEFINIIILNINQAKILFEEKVDETNMNLKYSLDDISSIKSSLIRALYLIIQTAYNLGKLFTFDEDICLEKSSLSRIDANKSSSSVVKIDELYVKVFNLLRPINGCADQ